MTRLLAVASSVPHSLSHGFAPLTLCETMLLIMLVCSIGPSTLNPG